MIRSNFKVCERRHDRQQQQIRRKNFASSAGYWATFSLDQNWQTQVETSGAEYLTFNWLHRIFILAQ